jgi:hypothetical protein
MLAEYFSSTVCRRCAPASSPKSAHHRPPPSQLVSHHAQVMDKLLDEVKLTGLTVPHTVHRSSPVPLLSHIHSEPLPQVPSSPFRCSGTLLTLAHLSRSTSEASMTTAPPPVCHPLPSMSPSGANLSKLCYWASEWCLGEPPVKTDLWFGH